MCGCSEQARPFFSISRGEGIRSEAFLEGPRTDGAISAPSLRLLLRCSGCYVLLWAIHLLFSCLISPVCLMYIARGCVLSPSPRLHPLPSPSPQLQPPSLCLIIACLACAVSDAGTSVDRDTQRRQGRGKRKRVCMSVCLCLCVQTLEVRMAMSLQSHADTRIQTRTTT